MPNLWHRVDVIRTSVLLPLRAAPVASPCRAAQFSWPYRPGISPLRKVPAMRKHTSPPLATEVSAVILEALRLALDVPLDAASEEPATPDAHLQTQLRFVQIGVWEARRRCLAGQTEELDVVLA